MVAGLQGEFRGGRGGGRGHRGYGTGRGRGSDCCSSNYSRIISATVDGKKLRERATQKLNSAQ